MGQQNNKIQTLMQQTPQGQMNLQHAQSAMHLYIQQNDNQGQPNLAQMGQQPAQNETDFTGQQAAQFQMGNLGFSNIQVVNNQGDQQPQQ